MNLCRFCLKTFDNCTCDNKDYADTYNYTPNELANLIIDKKITEEELDEQIEDYDND